MFFNPSAKPPVSCGYPLLPMDNISYLCPYIQRVFLVFSDTEIEIFTNMKLLSSSQCRAARALLNWSQSDLAKKADAHIQTISNFEKDAKIPSKKTLENIIRAFERAGIECTEDGGVRPQQPKVIVYRGKEGFADFRSDLINTVLSGVHAVCVSNVNEKQFEKWGRGEVNNHYYETMEKQKGLSFRILVQGPDYYIADHLKYPTYKWLPKELFGDITQYIYGEKTALISFRENDFMAYIIADLRISNFYRKEFDRLWLKAHQIDRKQKA